MWFYSRMSNAIGFLDTVASGMCIWAILALSEDVFVLGKFNLLPCFATLIVLHPLLASIIERESRASHLLMLLLLLRVWLQITAILHYSALLLLFRLFWHYIKISLLTEFFDPVLIEKCLTCIWVHHLSFLNLSHLCLRNLALRWLVNQSRSTLNIEECSLTMIDILLWWGIWISCILNNSALTTSAAHKSDLCQDVFILLMIHLLLSLTIIGSGVLRNRSSSLLSRCFHHYLALGAGTRQVARRL